MPIAAAEIADNTQNLILQNRSAQIEIFLEQAEQARFAEFLAIGTAGLRYTIGEEKNAITALQVDRRLRKTFRLECAEHATAVRKTMVRTIAMHDEGGIMSAICVAQSPRGTVEQCVKQRDETVARNISRHEGIQPGTQLIR